MRIMGIGTLLAVLLSAVMALAQGSDAAVNAAQDVKRSGLDAVIGWASATS